MDSPLKIGFQSSSPTKLMSKSGVKTSLGRIDEDENDIELESFDGDYEVRKDLNNLNDLLQYNKSAAVDEQYTSFTGTPQPKKVTRVDSQIIEGSDKLQSAASEKKNRRSNTVYLK